MTKTPVRLHDLFRYWRNLPHQLAAADQLEQQILAADPHLLDREQDWFHTWSQAGKQPEPDWVAPSLTIIKESEGLRLEAYKCPAGEWTIGYGTTRYPGSDGGAVRKGDVITAEQAVAYLRDDVLGLYGPGIFHLMPPARNWPGHRIAALVSWAFNCGLGAVETSTLRKRINAGEDPLKVIPEELPRWNKADGKVLEGLTRRRNAEVALFVGHQLQQPEPSSTPGRVTPASPFSTRLTPHIQVGEFALFQEARRFQNQHQVDTASELAAFMERARVQFGGKPVVITSGYRPPAINRSVGGASGSEHLYDAPGVGAVDFLIQGADIRAVQAWCDKEWPYSLGYGAPKGFVHLGIRRGRPRVRWDY